MAYYQLTEGVYRVEGGYGKDGEVYGGIFINTKPGLLIGASGGKNLVKSMEKIINDFNLTKLRIYFPHVTYIEIVTMKLLKALEIEITIYVHQNNIDVVTHPRDNFFSKRYINSDLISSKYTKALPKTLDNILSMTKAHTFETPDTKILVVPFGGPESGHSFIYSREHKMIFSGIILGRTSDPTSYYIDKTGSFTKNKSGLSFLDQAKAEILVPAYDEPNHIKTGSIGTEMVRDAISHDRESIYDLTSNSLKSVNDITEEFTQYYVDNPKSKPYDEVDLVGTKVSAHLHKLVEEEKLIKQDDQFRRT